jgi:NitT/TauT family transport system permease protein
MSSKIAYAASSAFFPIAFNCLRAFRGVDPKYVAVGRAYGASPRQMDWQIKFRASVPMAAAGLRIGCALTMVTVLVAEMLSATNGLGYLLKFYSQSFNTARSYAIILVILLVVGAFHFLISKLLPKNMEGRA